MNYQAFEKWLENLSDSDRLYLERHAVWKKDQIWAQTHGKLPEGFIEKTMEILEGGSESET